MDTRKPSIHAPHMWVYFSFCVLGLLACVNLWKFIQQIKIGIFGIDFIWRSLHLLTHRDNPYQVFFREMQPGRIAEGTPNYLIGGLLSMMPLGLLSEPDARWLWLALNIGFAIGILWLLQDRFPLSKAARWLIILAFFASAPLRVALLNCQTSLYVIFLFLLAHKCSSRYPWLAGILLALSLLKYSLTLPLAIWFGLKRERFQTIYWAAGWLVVLTCIGSWWMKCSPMDALIGPLRLTTAGGLAFIHSAADLFSISHHAGFHSLAIPGIVSLALLVLFHISLMSRRTPVADDMAMGFLAVLACLVFFHLSYDHVILLIPIWAGVRSFSCKSSAPYSTIAITVMACIPWIPKELWFKLSNHVPLVKMLGDRWWGMGFAELANFTVLLGLVFLLIPQVAGRPSIMIIKSKIVNDVRSPEIPAPQ